MLNHLFRTTQHQSNWWRSRQIDWDKDYLATWNHPHRFFITDILSRFPWISLIEIGCGPGPNLVNIVKHLPNKQVGGVDVNPEAIELASKTFVGGIFKVNSGDDIMMSDKSTDVSLVDMAFIYVTPSDIGRYIEEMKRITRNWVVLCEFHHENWFMRKWLKYTSGYNAYNWRKLLTKHGFFDIINYKITEEMWPGGDPQKTFGHIFVARVPKRG